MIREAKDKYESPNNSVQPEELNSWRRGFTPQAEIWNGRMAIVGLIIFLSILLIYNAIYT